MSIGLTNYSKLISKAGHDLTIAQAGVVNNYILEFLDEMQSIR